MDRDLNAGASLPLFKKLESPRQASGSSSIAKGQSIKLTNSGKLALRDAQVPTMLLNGDGIITITVQITFNDLATFLAGVHFEKDVQVDQTLAANPDVKGGGISLEIHTHTSESPGTATSPPI
ncbi:MAG TPA: hypothetical protein VHZ53_17605 [Steroidobacteraceae bacterium]|nr:hypothetical protein [Steroidobacteraceae bacterium]